MSQSYPHRGGHHRHGHPVEQPVEVAAGEVDHDVSPDEGEAHQGVEAQEDGEDCIGRLELSPQQHGVYVVPRESDSILLVMTASPMFCPTVTEDLVSVLNYETTEICQLFKSAANLSQLWTSDVLEAFKI